MEEVRETTDIFLWANQTDAKKNDLQIELFLFGGRRSVPGRRHPGVLPHRQGGPGSLLFFQSL